MLDIFDFEYVPSFEYPMLPARDGQLEQIRRTVIRRPSIDWDSR